MFLTRCHNNTSVSKKKTFITLTSRSKSKERDNSQVNVTRDRDRSEERYASNIGCETTVSLNNLQVEKAENVEKAAKRQAYLCKNRNMHKMASLVLDYQQFQEYHLQQTSPSLWNHNSPINKLADYLQGQV